jgi:hypothetical protein
MKTTEGDASRKIWTTFFSSGLSSKGSVACRAAAGLGSRA